MRRRLLIAAGVVLLLVPVALLGVLLYTKTGVELLVRQLSRLEHIDVRVQGVAGTLAGPLRIARFELDHPRVHVVSHDLVIDTQIRGLLLWTVQIGSLTARDTQVQIREAKMPPTDRPPRFAPTFMRVDARGVDLSGVRYVHVNGTTVDARRIEGRVTVTSRHLRARDVRIDAELFDAAGELRMRAGRPHALEGTVNGHLRPPRGAELTLSAQVDGTLDRLAIKGEMQQPNSASVAAVFTRQDRRWRIEGRVVAAEFALQPWLENAPFSLRNVSLDVQANPDEVQVAGNLVVPQLDSNDLSINARGRYAARTLHVHSSDIALSDTPARLQTAGTVVFGGEAPVLNLTARWQSLQWPLRGKPAVASTQGNGTMRGSQPYDFAIDAQVAAPDVPQATGSARGVLAKKNLELAQYDIQALGGSLSGSATLDFAQPRAWTLSMRAVDIDPQQLHDEFPGKVSFAAKGTGRGLNRNANFALTVGDLRGSLRGEPVNGGGTVERDARGWQVRGASIGLGDAQLALDGTLRDTIDARWSLSAPSLQQLLPGASGAVEFNGTASGPRKSPHVIANLRAENLRYRQWQAAQLTINADLDAVGKNPSRLFVLARRAGHGQPLVDTLRMTGDGTAENHSIGVEVTGLAANPRATPPRAELQVAGHYDQRAWKATVTTTHLSRGAGRQEISIDEPAHVLVARNRATLDNLCLVVGAGRLCANGEWQRNGAWEGTVSGYEIPLATVLPPSGNEAEYAGRIEGRVRAFGAAGQPWQGEAGMRIIDAAIIYRPPGAEPQTLNLGTGGLAATATPERIDFSFGLQAFTDTFLYANAQLLRNGGNDILNMPLTGDMRARAADANVLPLVFSEIDHAAGLLTANATVTGALAAPEINGRVELANGEFDSYRVNLALRELSLIADLASNGLDFRGTGRAGDGQLDVGGRLTWEGGESRGNLHLRGKDLLVADLPDYRVVASPDLRFRIEGERMDVTGEVAIPSARAQPAELGGAVRASDDARYVDEHPAEQAGRLAVHSDVRIVMGDDVRIDTFGLQGRITGAVTTITNTGETTLGRGELGVIEGRYEAYGQELAITRGQLLFDNSPLNDPGLDIEARREIETVVVGMNVRGTLQEPRLTFFSEPSMPQTQIVAYLLGGKSMDDLTGGDTTTTNSAALQGGGFLASQLGRRLGLEEVGVQSSVDAAGETNTSLVLGKFLSPRLFISYGISLTESINTMKMRYTMSDKWILRMEAGEDQSADVEYMIER